jgi:hypothetical protein
LGYSQYECTVIMLISSYFFITAGCLTPAQTKRGV